MSWTVLQDSREKQPWDFTKYGFEQEQSSLKTGDYTIKGYESILCIERKKNTGEIAINFGKERERFFRELDRMQSFQYKYLICEFSFDDVLNFPNNSGIPVSKRKFIRMNSGFIASTLNKIQVDYGVNIIHTSSKAESEYAAIEIFNKVRYG